MKKKVKSADRQRAGEEFRLFAWNLAGQLAKPAGKPATPAVKR
jgi:hypothetical protein